jgi:hypothetical protein
MVLKVKDIMMRVGLALLSTLQYRLLRCDFEKLHHHFKDYCMKADPVFVFVQALKIQFNTKLSIIEVSFFLSFFSFLSCFLVNGEKTSNIGSCITR